MNNQKILELSNGLFGQISVGETCDFASSTRWMKIKNEIEGQVFSFPDANFFSTLSSGPGAIAASRYLYAFIIAAWQFANKKGLVLGLGAGAGVIMLLTLFPALSLTVVEIDSQVIRLARSYFPLISFYETQGRLQIIESDAEIYLDQCRDSFAFTLLDLFSGDEKSHNNLLLINKVLKISLFFMANIITSKTDISIIERSLNLNINIRLMWLLAAPSISSEKANWIMTNINEISPEIQQYQLFDNLTTIENVITANKYFKYILSQVDAACFYR